MTAVLAVGAPTPDAESQSPRALIFALPRVVLRRTPIGLIVITTGR